MATNRSRRLRKKLCVDEFQELGCELTLNFREGLADAEMDSFVEAFLRDAVEGNGLGYVGGDDYGFVCLAKRGSMSAAQREQLDAWLKSRAELTGYSLSPLMDVWYPENAVNPA
ncbi:conserved hypothetical protein [Pseudomonas sp. 8AS]|uniref:YggL 50S ribosome-binding family protein n=1 Tax=Pseudomonas sp. 8AS TaxID=2653163 RepID=UPI0012F3FDC5|nr:50S ribosome-binding protein YggL [Pseudomonas sp. 8AS]VXC36142.1 conserved hypothetical protein [Pseudomonas sp. 8AS]